ncbi:MAG: LysM peptidoglycan-binding domain-containing protein [Acidobacteriota bacterium]
MFRRASLPLTLACFALLVLGAGAPPRDLKQVGDHWTAWDPPGDFPEGAQVHIIQPGETLWGLAGRFYENPYLWPQLWELNQYIHDAHWIYPGDPLVVGLDVVDPQELAQLPPGEEIPASLKTGGEAVVNLDAQDSGLGVLSFEKALGAPEALGTESDVYCSGFVGGLEENLAYSIIGTEFDVLSPDLEGSTSAIRIETEYGVVDTVKYGLAGGDIIYVSGGRSSGLYPGQELTVIQPRGVVEHPHTEEVSGRYYRQKGLVRILSVQDDTAIAELALLSCGEVTVGDFLRPFEPTPVPLGRTGNPRPLNLPENPDVVAEGGTIILADDEVVSIGQNHIVHIDLGDEDEIIPGDLFTIYRENRRGLPPVVLGELAVLTVVGPSNAVARVLESRYPIYIGDRLTLK